MVKQFQEKVDFIWSVADLLRGPYKPAQYGRVILPLTVLRRLDCVLESSKDKVLAKYAELKGGKVANIEPLLNRVAKASFHNTSKLDFKKLKGESDKIAANLTAYIKAFSTKVRDIFDRFTFEPEIAKLDEHNRLFLVVSKFADIDLHPSRVPNIEMGYIFEELIRRFNEAANETAGDHFTPREVIRLMVNLLFAPDRDILIQKGILKTLCDPACGTGGMLAVADEYLHELNPDAKLEVFGQDHNPESYAVCGSDMLIKGHNIDNIVFGSSFTKVPDGRYDYMLANPPFGVDWKADQETIEKEYKFKGYDGRFGAGLPPIDQGAVLFLQHMLSKVKAVKDGGSRIGIVFNSNALFSGDAGSGPSEIRRWIIESDWLEAIIALPDQLFYNTGIHTYIWIVTNRKPHQRRGKVQFINAVDLYHKKRPSLNNKRHEIGDEHIAEITRLYGEFSESENSKIFDNSDFGYRQITVERPLRLNFQATPERIEKLHARTAFRNLATSKKKNKKQAAAQQVAGREKQTVVIKTLSTIDPSRIYRDRESFIIELNAALADAGISVSAPVRKSILSALSERDENAEICRDSHGNPEPDASLRDYENVPLKVDIHEYFESEVRRIVSDAWINDSVTDHKDGQVGRVGYSLPFPRFFFKFTKKVELNELQDSIAQVQADIAAAAKEAEKIRLVLTRGLDPNVTMKDSGVPWIGDIPSHWDVCKTKRVAKLKTGHTPSRKLPEYWVDCTIPWFSLSDVWQLREGRNEYLGETSEKISELGLANSAAELLPQGTVIVSRTASVGFSGIMPEPMATTQDFVNWICGPRILPEYLLYVFRSMKQEFQRLTMGSTHKTIYMPDVWSFTTPLPPLEEQHDIVEFVRSHSAILMELEDRILATVERIRDCRTSLVARAITSGVSTSE
jgi:type I restriction enzyme M protein